MRLAVCFAALALAAAPAALASQVVSTSTATAIQLGVNAKGEAMLSYTQAGKRVHVLAWGAVNALAPTTARSQVKLELAYDGGFQKEFTDDPDARAALAHLRDLQSELAKATARHDNPTRYALAPKIKAAFAELARLREAASNYWQTFACPRYDGPVLAFRAAACKAPDGSWWAVQVWQRQLPDYGAAPTAAQRAYEVHLSHWTGALPVLTVAADWSYKKWDHLYGTYTYDGKPVHGFRSTPGGQPLDTFGRNLYLDSFGSDYPGGSGGWLRVNSFLAHNPTGAFCYGFFPHPTATSPTGMGSRYRLTAIGPGLTPDVSVTLAAPGPYDATADATANDAIRTLGDRLCKPN